ncbi:hypothetical protein BC830DRAFT_1083085 [Chytriomyces sp. MP71]|nr:hypothetical protein BC830DRAFT_1083085 [Chytriomyces sp. MP71]
MRGAAKLPMRLRESRFVNWSNRHLAPLCLTLSTLYVDCMEDMDDSYHLNADLGVSRGRDRVDDSIKAVPKRTGSDETVAVVTEKKPKNASVSLPNQALKFLQGSLMLIYSPTTSTSNSPSICIVTPQPPQQPEPIENTASNVITSAARPSMKTSRDTVLYSRNQNRKSKNVYRSGTALQSLLTAEEEADVLLGYVPDTTTRNVTLEFNWTRE